MGGGVERQEVRTLPRARRTRARSSVPDGMEEGGGAIPGTGGCLPFIILACSLWFFVGGVFVLFDFFFILLMANIIKELPWLPASRCCFPGLTCFPTSQRPKAFPSGQQVIPGD